MSQEAFEVDIAGKMVRGMSYQPDVSTRVPCVLFLHGFTGQRIEGGFLFVQLARALNARGIGAVAFDFRNSGESDGSFDQMLVTEELEDALKMIRWMQGRPNVDRTRMGLLGFSLGGLLGAACMSRTNAISSLALLAPTTVANLCRHAGETPGQTVTVGPHTLHPKFFDDMKTLNPVADIISHPRPTLIVQGMADKAVTPEISQAYVDALRREGQHCEQSLIDECDHGFSSPPARRRVIAEVTDWFARTL